jgi:ubiquinone/menaquinone biosynthesis C-methylase UbiE
MSSMNRVVRQFVKPAGWFGRFNLSNMNRRHSALTDWGLEHVSIEKKYTILDVGCGGGRTVSKLAAMAPEGKVYGVDHSEASVAVSQRTNKPWIEKGRVEIRPGSVSQLPFADNSFDLATAVENHFYWPDLPADLREVLRVLKPGGALLVIAEVYKGGKNDTTVQKFVDVMAKAETPYAHLSVDEHRALFSAAGYAEAQVFEDYDKGWICAIGRKPSLAST